MDLERVDYGSMLDSRFIGNTAGPLLLPLLLLTVAGGGGGGGGGPPLTQLPSNIAAATAAAAAAATASVALAGHPGPLPSSLDLALALINGFQGVNASSNSSVTATPTSYGGAVHLQQVGRGFVVWDLGFGVLGFLGLSAQVVCQHRICLLPLS